MLSLLVLPTIITYYYVIFETTCDYVVSITYQCVFFTIHYYDVSVWSFSLCLIWKQQKATSLTAAAGAAAATPTASTTKISHLELLLLILQVLPLILVPYYYFLVVPLILVFYYFFFDGYTTHLPILVPLTQAREAAEGSSSSRHLSGTSTWLLFFY